MLVTIYTDASLYPETKVGAWAFWARSDAGRIAKHGVFKAPIANPDDAELFCIANAIHYVVDVWPMATTIFINTDSLNCITLLVGGRKSKKQYVNDAADSIKERVNKGTKRVLRMKHIKGHQGKNKSVQTWLNNWCDTTAKRAAKGVSNT